MTKKSPFVLLTFTVIVSCVGVLRADIFHPVGLSPGDHYRIAFTTENVIDGEQSRRDYNDGCIPILCPPNRAGLLAWRQAGRVSESAEIG